MRGARRTEGIREREGCRTAYGIDVGDLIGTLTAIVLVESLRSAVVMTTGEKRFIGARAPAFSGMHIFTLGLSDPASVDNGS